MTYTCTRPGCEIQHDGRGYCPTCTAEIKQNLAEQRLAQGTADTCSCPPGDCHGGHTINIGPAWVCVPEERLRQLRDDPFATRAETVTVDPETQSMAAELLALRAALSDRDDLYKRVEELEAERDQHAETARQATNHAINSAATIATVRHALAGHPRCEEHPEGDVIKCGWKRVVGSVQAALDAAPAQPEPIGYTAALRGADGKLCEVFGGTDLTQKFAEQRVGYWRRSFPETDAVLVELREVTE